MDRHRSPATAKSPSPATKSTNASTAIGLIPVAGTIQSAVELATGYDFIAGEEADRRAAMLGLVPGGKGIANGAEGIINAVAPLPAKPLY